MYVCMYEYKNNRVSMRDVLGRIGKVRPEADVSETKRFHDLSKPTGSFSFFKIENGVHFRRSLFTET